MTAHGEGGFLRLLADSEGITASRGPQNRPDYMKAESLYAGARFIMECCAKLNVECLTTATAAALFHKFFKVAKKENHDQYLIAAACIYLSGKLEENSQLKIRDLINVAHTTLHRNAEPMGLDTEYYNMRDVICQAELLVLRMVKFETRFDHPHKYLLHHLRSLKFWMSEDVWRRYPIGRTSWAILQDFYHHSRALDVRGETVSLACIFIALQTYGIQVPYTAHDGTNNQWFNAFAPLLTSDELWDAKALIMEVYNDNARHFGQAGEA